MVATGSPEATEAAVRILEAGGNAVDAAVAASFTLGVSDSDASGLGGETYMVIRFANGQAVAIDGTARAPSRFDLASLQATASAGVEVGHEMVAVPTTLAVLDFALRKYGSITLADALQPAIETAERGYELSEIQIVWTRKYYDSLLATSTYLPFLLMEDGKTVGEPGDRICNEHLAETYRRIAREGASTFYRGRIADEIEADMKRNGGNLRKGDLVRYRVIERIPVSTTYRGLEIQSVPPPGGGDTLVHALNILENFPSDLLAENSLTRQQTLIEAFRIALNDRAGTGAGMMPPTVPGAFALTKRHAYDRARMITPGKIIPKATIAGPIDPECLPVGETTTQVSVIDAAGNAVSLTQTLGRSFGAKVATPGLGFPYNNFLQTFRFDKPQCPGFLRSFVPCANDMAPTILTFDDGRIVVLGTPGSNRIPAILANVIINMVDRGMNLREAIESPRILWGGGEDINVDMEVAGPLTRGYVDAFNAMGYEHPVEPVYYPAGPDDMTSFGAVNSVEYDPAQGTFVGVADPRRGGLAKGPRVVVERK
jgi:gamma-glutamyltranspeptidase/glutathione hydrolase